MKPYITESSALKRFNLSADDDNLIKLLGDFKINNNTFKYFTSNCNRSRGDGISDDLVLAVNNSIVLSHYTVLEIISRIGEKK